MNDPWKWAKRQIERLIYKWPEYNKALKKGTRPSQLKDKRVKIEHQCNKCKKWFKKTDIKVDHIIPKGRYDKDTFLVWFERYFCSVDGLQKLCKPCHDKKSAGEHKDGSYK
jgi:5-methylcytosine-specific restriction endonuclease McrA